MNDKKVLVFLVDGFEEIEALTTIDILRRCGVEVQIVSVTGTRLIHGSHDISIMAETVFRKCEIYKSHGIILPGGMLATFFYMKGYAKRFFTITIVKISLLLSVQLLWYWGNMVY